MPPCRCLPFKPSRNIYAVAENVVPVDDNLAEVYPDTELDRPLRCEIALAHRALDGDGASTASTTLPNSTSAPSPIILTMRPWRAATAGLNVSFQIRRIAAIVLASSACIIRAVTGDIGGKDRGEAPSDLLFCHAASIGRAGKSTLPLSRGRA